MATDHRIYRLSADIDTSANSTVNPLPTVTLSIAAYQQFSAQLYTSLTEINPLQLWGNQTNPAADGLSTYTAYLALPEGAALNGGMLGNSVGGNVRLTDRDATQGGSITGDNMRIISFPEAILP